MCPLSFLSNSSRLLVSTSDTHAALLLRRHDGRHAIALPEAAVRPEAGIDRAVGFLVGAESVGLVVAELELEAADAPYERPDWLGVEVTDEARYYNLALAERPYSRWSAQEKA